MLLLWDSRVHDLLHAVRTFISESGYPITYDEKNSTDYLWLLLNHEDSAVFVNYHEGKITGFVICYRAKEFHSEYFGYINKFYVMPEFRGTRAGRELLTDACEWFDLMGCVESFATASANIGQDKLYINLLAKFKFFPKGGVLSRKKQQ